MVLIVYHCRWSRVRLAAQATGTPQNLLMPRGKIINITVHKKHQHANVIAIALPYIPPLATMVRLLPIIAATISISKPVCHGFVTQRSRASDVRPLGVQLEGREIEGALTPTNNFVLVKKAEIQDETEGGILLTGSVSNSYCILTVHLIIHI